MSVGWVMGRALVAGCVVASTVGGCGFQGLNSLPLPGTAGREPHADIYHVEVANVSTLESNSPVLIDDVEVGSVGKMTLNGWHADVEVSVKPDVVIPANAVASVGQTSLLGSMHLSLNPPLGQAPVGRLAPGSTIALSKSSTYPSTEQTLASLSAVVNGGGLGQIGDIIHNLNTGLAGHEPQVRDLLGRLNTFIGVLDEQRDSIVASIQALNRLAGTFAGQRDVLDRALREIPPALDVLIQERPRLTTALAKLGTFSDTASGLIRDSQADLALNLTNLEPALKALADIGPELDAALAGALTFPFSQNFIDRGIRGDYMNLFDVFDLTVPRLKRTLFLGTRWGEPGTKLVPAPGDPSYATYTYDPVGSPLAPPADTQAAPAGAIVNTQTAEMPPVTGPVLPVVPPAVIPEPVPAGNATSGIFAGPYFDTPPPAAPPSALTPPGGG